MTAPASRSDTPSSGNDRRKRLVRIAVVLAVLGLSVWYVVGMIDWAGLGRALVEMHAGWIVAGVCCTLGAHLARAHRWRLLIPQGGSIRLLDSFSATIIGYLMNNVIPRSGELVRPYVLSKRDGRPMSGLVATVLVERVLDGLSLVAIFVGLLLVSSERLQKVFVGYSSTGILLSIILPLLVIVLIVVLLVKTRLGEQVLARLGRIVPQRIVAKLTGLLNDFRSGITFGGKWGVVLIVFWSAVIWAGYCGAIYFGFQAFGLDTAYGMGAADALTVLAITAVGVTIAPTPGAFGVYHLFCTGALTTLYHVNNDTAVAFALVTHAAPYLAVMITGSLFLLRENVSMKDAVRQRQER
ncbi:MAG: flippase-like domain-containing protein [Bacteroidetes bacterium]|nr:flippase-like domain-containing protein [Bacteroidota bacterium]